MSKDKKEPTLRQLQADATRAKIYDVAVKLMEDKGFQKTTIEEIASKAGVSVGTFYHYFKSKEAVFFDLFKKADEYFEHTVAPVLDKAAASGLSASAQVVLFFKYYGTYNVSRGFANISQLYNTKNQLFTKKGRYMQQLLKRIITKGQSSGQLTRKMKADDIVEFLFIANRGVVYDWCINGGSYDLVAKSESYTEILVKVLLPK
jgi:AcrR family transcriptional regulator